MERDDLSELAYKKMASLCARTEYCKADIYRKLYKYEDIDKEAIVDRLESEGFINEARYAKAFVHDKTLFTHWSKERIVYELHMRHIKDEDIEAAYEDRDD